MLVVELPAASCPRYFHRCHSRVCPPPLAGCYTCYPRGRFAGWLTGTATAFLPSLYNAQMACTNNLSAAQRNKCSEKPKPGKHCIGNSSGASHLHHLHSCMLSQWVRLTPSMSRQGNCVQDIDKSQDWWHQAAEDARQAAATQVAWLRANMGPRFSAKLLAVTQRIIKSVGLHDGNPAHQFPTLAGSHLSQACTSSL